MIRRRVDWRSDDGMTLAELVVGMGLMMVFMTIFTTVIFLMNSASARVSAVRQGTNTTSSAFLALDKTVRYASAISTPSATANPNGRWYVEFQTTSTGATDCTQLQLDTTTNKLNRRTWTATSGGYSDLTGFVPIASNVVIDPNATGGVPFAMYPLTGSGSIAYEQLTVSIVASQQVGAQPVTTSSAMTFTAVNSNQAYQDAISTPSSPGTICTGVGRP